MSLSAEQVTKLVRMAGERFEFDDFEEMELTEDEITRDADGIASIDIVREETDELYRFTVLERPLNLSQDIVEVFDKFREVEFEADEEHSGCVLVCQSAGAGEFVYVYRNESGEVGLYHSELSIDDDELDDDGDEDEDDEPDHEEEATDEEENRG